VGNRFNANKQKENSKKIPTPRGSQSNPVEQQKPVFSLHYLNRDFCLSACNRDEKASFADAMYKLSQITWNEVICSHRHGLGFEKISRDAIKSTIPEHLTDDVRMIAFRFHGKAPMVGYRDGNVFHVIWFDRAFTLYDHG
jgi:hypothetical protein